MGGLEEIIRQIKKDADAEAQAILAKAKEDCDAIEQEAQTQITEIEQNGDKIAEKESRQTLDKIKSSANMQAKMDCLQAKQEMIAEVIEKAYEKMANAPQQEYFDRLLHVLEAYVQPKEGVICLNKTDLARLPADFEKRAKEIAARHNGTLEIGKEAIEIENGMILDYGDIEENCTILSMFQNKKEQLQDTIHAFLFQ